MKDTHKKPSETLTGSETLNLVSRVDALVRPIRNEIEVLIHEAYLDGLDTGYAKGYYRGIEVGLGHKHGT